MHLLAARDKPADTAGVDLPAEEDRLNYCRLTAKEEVALIQADHGPEEEPVSLSRSKDCKTGEDNPLDATTKTTN